MTVKTTEPCGCGCDGGPVANVYSLRLNLSSTESRREVFKGVDHLVVPLVMLRETVVNGGLVLMSELKPQSWNGTPVTIGHPEVSGKPVSANTPKVLEQWQVGHIFNAFKDADKLKAEAWLNIEATEAFRPGLIGTLSAGVEMDVSTGYYSSDVPSLGEHNGKPYFEIHQDLKPDHLALLPDEEGACNWEDGCGVRVNKENKRMSKEDTPEELSPETAAGITRFFIKTFGRQIPKTNLRGEDDDFRQMVADLISNDNSPFVPEDEYSLREMSYDTVVAMRDQYVKNNTAKEGTDPVTDTNTNAAPVTATEVADIVANALKTHAEETKTMVDTAVETAMNANERAALVDEIHDHTSVEKEELGKLSINALRAMKPKTNTASGKADMSGRGMKVNGDDGSAKVKTFPGMNTNAATKAAEEKKEA